MYIDVVKNKKVLLLSSILLIVLVFCSLYTVAKQQALEMIPQSGYTSLSVRLENIKLIHNYNVGDSWDFYATINGKKIVKGETAEVSVRTTDKMIITATVIEKDIIPDIGGNKSEVSINSLDFSKKTKYPVSVRVAENRGKYSGHIAEWQFIFTVKRKISISEILSSMFSMSK